MQSLIQPPSQLPPIQPPSDHQNTRPPALAAYLSRPVRVAITDSRVFRGTLLCIDPNLNLILGGASFIKNTTTGINSDITESLQDEKLDGNTNTSAREKYIGMVVLPGRHITKIEAYC